MHNIENVFIGWEYNSIAKKILSQYKYRYAYKLSEILSQLLLERLRVTKFLDLIQSDSLLVPIPSHHSHIQKRGFNQSYLIAQYLSNFLKIPLGKNLITRIGNSNYQSTKSLNDRKQLKDVFKPIEDIKGKNIVILDDVITTGTTLNRVSKSLKGNNIKAIVLFRGRPRFHL
jgi:ComF family protein